MMSQLGRLALIPLLAASCAAHAVDAPVLAKKEVTLKGRTDADVQVRELWYSKHDGAQWGAFQKHGLTFPPQTPIVWACPEGHWRTYVRIIEVSGGAMPVPAEQKEAKLFTEFVIDRTAPAVAVQFPTAAAKLRGGQKYTVKWSAQDPNLAQTPIALQWSRAGDGKFETVAEKLPNNGAYEWTVPRDMTVSGQLRVTALDLAGNLGAGDAAQVLVDSIAPTGRVTGPTISASAENLLQLNVTDAGPAGLARVQVWASQDDGQTWSEGPIAEAPFKSVGWKAPGDGRFRFAVVAVDQAGNPTPTPKGKSDDQGVLLVDSQKPVILLSQANGLVEAEGMKPRKNFLPGHRVAVQFDVKDVALAANPVTVWLATEGGTWEVVGKDLPADAAYRFEIPAKPSRAARIKVSAVDVAGNVGEVVAGEPFVIDTEVETTGNTGLE
jgi:hypothetical protein